MNDSRLGRRTVRVCSSSDSHVGFLKVGQSAMNMHAMNRQRYCRVARLYVSALRFGVVDK
jgi:hypothetical protein